MTNPSRYTVADTTPHDHPQRAFRPRRGASSSTPPGHQEHHPVSAITPHTATGPPEPRTAPLVHRPTRPTPPHRPARAATGPGGPERAAPARIRGRYPGAGP